ncbi:hypothetical protein GC194_10970, partial [bacterium]|nr:hypothetical protein [bacterium]
SSIDTARLDNTLGIDPAYTKKNTYRYNSLNQLTLQNTINGGTTNYFYDPVGRLILSQNDKQAPNSEYTYNIYDKQSRMVETGQVQLPGPTFSSYSYDSMAATIRANDRQDVVLTTYDEEAVDLLSVAGVDRQENLRKRVAVVKYFDSIFSTDTAFVDYTYATHYSYDMAGNVKTLTHDFPELATIGQQYKRVDYDYDLISGKVNMLSYNRGHADQYYQRYHYDADNRLTSVQTSSDGYIWDNDATYSYYDHGPLARVELGKLHVQGIDFAYTIQGWLKAVNGDTLGPELDMNRDGDTALGSVFCPDVVSHTLDYFRQDYKPVAAWQMQHVPDPTLNLYNGNIARQTMAIGKFFYNPLHKQYIYDQFNRIKEADYFSVNADAGTITPTDDYKNTYDYDLDGNILALNRNAANPGGAGLAMDRMTYEYLSSTSNTDLLGNISDCAADIPEHDIMYFCPAGPTAPRYQYDAIGNTIMDMVSGQDTIEWNLYNKVTRAVNNMDTSRMYFAYDGMGNRVSKTYVQNVPPATIRTSTDYYVRDAQGNILATYLGVKEIIDSSGSPAKDAFGLRSHEMYGSSRLGTKTYDPKIVGREITYDGPEGWYDTMRLNVRVPWYSLEYQDNIIADSVNLYGNSWKDSLFAWHRMGEKRYELTDHLGNVLATISDQHRMRTYDTIPGYPPAGQYPVLATSYKSELTAAYDYYPFGMMMPARMMNMDDSSVFSSYATLDHLPAHRWMPLRTDTFSSACAPCSIDSMGTTRLSFASPGVTAIDTYYTTTSTVPLPHTLTYGNWMLRYRIGGLHPGVKNRIKIYVRAATMSATGRFVCDLFQTSYSFSLDTIPTAFIYGAPTTITAVVGPPYPVPTDTAVILAIGWQKLFDTTSPHPPYDYSITLDSIVTEYDSVVDIHNAITLLNQGTSYPYGFNGQVKNNEIAGVGNQYDFKFRGYDPRVARFSGVDPLAAKYPWYTPYQFAGNTPIWARDLEGLEPWYSNGSQGQGGQKDQPASLHPTDFGPYSAEYAEAHGVSGVPTINLGDVSVTPHHDPPIPDKNSHDPNIHQDYMTYTGEIPGESTLERGLRLGAGFSYEARRDWASGGSMMYGGYGRTTRTSLKLLIEFGDDAAILENAANLASKRGWYDIVVHGTSDGRAFSINGQRTTAEALYRQILGQGYTQGTKIRLMSCYSGSIENGAAQQLSNLTQAPVMAPENWLTITDGLGLFPKFYIGEGRWFKMFYPK